MNPYNSIITRYPLLDTEISDMDNIWNFISIFTMPHYNISDYRRILIKKIQDTYSVSEFLKLENTADKLFWNLRNILLPIYNNKISRKKYNNIISSEYQINNAESYKRLTTNVIVKTFLVKPYYRSCINKLILMNNDNIFYKEMEGSSFQKNKLNLINFTILFNRKLYEKVMSDPYEFNYNELILPIFYWQKDYSFPNLNTYSYNFYNERQKINRIQKYYYNEEGKKDKYWFKLIK